MIPANSRHIRKLSRVAPSVLQSFLTERDGRVVKSSHTQWTDLKDGLKVYIKLHSGEKSFNAQNYSVISNTLIFAKQQHELDRSGGLSVVVECDKNVVPHVDAVVSNACRLYSVPPSMFRVVGTTSDGNLYERNIVDFLRKDAEKLSVRQISELLRGSARKNSSTPSGARLAGIIDQFVVTLNWERSFKLYGSNILMCSSNPQDTQMDSFNALEHVERRGFVAHPVLAQTSHFDEEVKYPHNNFLSNSAYEIYQYCLRIPDYALLKALTLLSVYTSTEIGVIVQKHKKAPHEYYGQKKVAENLLMINKSVDPTLVEACEVAAGYMFRNIKQLLLITYSDMDCIEKVVHTVQMDNGQDWTLSRLCAHCSQSLSTFVLPKFETFVHKVMTNGVAFCNGRQIELNHTFSRSDKIIGRSILADKLKQPTSVFMVVWKSPP